MKAYRSRCEEYSNQNQQLQSSLMILMMESWRIIIQNILGLLSTDHTQHPTGAKSLPRLNFFLQFKELTDLSTQTSSMDLTPPSLPPTSLHQLLHYINLQIILT